jgi:rubrerythrin
MKNKPLAWLAGCAGLLAAATLVFPQESVNANLLSAQRISADLALRYQEYAKQAAVEGYAGMALLFRAGQQSEQYQSAGIKALLDKRGAFAPAISHPSPAQTTTQNCAILIQDLSRFDEEPFPLWVKSAKTVADIDAVRALNYSRTAKESMLELLRASAADLTAARRQATDYFVCSVCGYIVTKIDFDKCPSCFFPRKNYQKVL